MSPEKGPFRKEIRFPTIIFLRGYVSFRGIITYKYIHVWLLITI